MGNGFEFGNDPAKIDRYRRFWERAATDRPLVGFSMKSWFPLDEFAASAAWPPDSYLTPDMIDPEAFLDDQERLLREGERIDDDILRGASPSQAVPWLCGTLGNRLRILPGSILAEDRTLPWEALEGFTLDRESPWYRKYQDFAEALVRRSDGRFPVSHGTLVGPSDIFAALRGHGQSVLDMMDDPERSERLMHTAGELFRQMTEDIWAKLPRFHGGWYDAQYQIWAPGPIARLQEDVVALYSPDLYRRFIQPVDREVASHFPSAFMHLHSTSMFVLDLFLEVDEIRLFEINNDVGGPPIEKMIPHFRKVQQARKPLLIRGSFSPDELRLLMDSLEPAGLYLYIMVQDEAEIERLRPILGM